MEQPKYILQFVCYSPQIFSGLDKFFVLLTRKLRMRGITPVFVYGETMTGVRQIQQDLEVAGAIVETMPEKGKRNMCRSVRSLYKKYHPELVDTHFVNFLRAYTAVYSHLHGIRHFTHLHSLLADCTPHEYCQKKGFLKRWLLGVYYALLNSCGEVVCVSKAIEQQFQQWAYGKKNHVQTLYLGTDLTPSTLTKLQACERLGLPQDETLFVNISAKEELKSIDIIIKELSGGKFVHIGGLRADNEQNREYEQTLFRLVADLHKEQQVVWLGKRYDIREILPAFDIYVHPSRMEGLPVSLMEAAAAGLPLIGTKVGGIPEIIQHGLNGILIEYGDWQGLHDAMERLRCDETLRNQMGENAKQTAINCFDMDGQTSRLLELYLGA